jgi:hypothetical protein
MVNRVVFYKRAIPADLSSGFYDSPVFCVDFQGDVSQAQALEHAHKLFKKQMGSTPEDWGVRWRIE